MECTYNTIVVKCPLINYVKKMVLQKNFYIFSLELNRAALVIIINILIFFLSSSSFRSRRYILRMWHNRIIVHRAVWDAPESDLLLLLPSSSGWLAY